MRRGWRAVARGSVPGWRLRERWRRIVWRTCGHRWVTRIAPARSSRGRCFGTVPAAPLWWSCQRVLFGWAASRAYAASIPSFQCTKCRCRRSRCRNTRSRSTSAGAGAAAGQAIGQLLPFLSGPVGGVVTVGLRTAGAAASAFGVDEWFEGTGDVDSFVALDEPFEAVTRGVLDALGSVRHEV